MSEYDPIPDAIRFLARKAPIERHAIARLLDTDGKALPVLQWIVEQPDCDRATAAMTFWRLWSLPVQSHHARQADVSARTAVLESIAANVSAGRYAAAKIAWDGFEAWQRTPLVAALRADGVTIREAAIPALLFGPFGTAEPEPAKYAFLEEPYDVDDIFDSLWRTGPTYAAAADWLVGKSAEIWMAAVDGLQGSHPEDVYEWMVLQPGCPSSVAGQIFWSHGPEFDAERQLDGQREPPRNAAVIDHVLARWRKSDFARCDLDFSRYSNAAGYRALLDRFPGKADPLDVPPDLLDPPKGRHPAPVCLYDDFDFWFFRVDLGALVPRGRDAAVAEWNASKADEAQRRESDRARAEAAAAPPSFLERLFYGGKFTGAKAQIDCCWRQFNLVMAVGAIILIALMRGGAPAIASFSALLALVAVLSVYQSSAKMGGPRRIVAWWTGAFLISMALAFMFRWIDKGVVI
jgi:hypothetical protein